MQQLTTPNWNSYELIDTGDGLRLEKYAGITVVRPDTQVLWPKTQPNHAGWENPDALFLGQDEGWQLKDKDLEKGWEFTWNKMKLLIKPTPFRHMGVFPEQAAHWAWLDQLIHSAGREVKVLNLFAYTGASTVVAAQAGAKVTHVDASKGTVYWASDNAKLSGLSNDRVRWIVDDALKFVRREVKRGERYDIIVMDPPVFGRGSKGEIWRLEEDLGDLLEVVSAVFSDKPLGFLLNFYATSTYPDSIIRLAEHYMGKHFTSLEGYSLCLEESSSKKPFPTGFSLRS